MVAFAANRSDINLCKAEEPTSSCIEVSQSNHCAQNPERFLRISVLYISHVDEIENSSQCD
jgi:hypothetical protein